MLFPCCHSLMVCFQLHVRWADGPVAAINTALPGGGFRQGRLPERGGLPEDCRRYSNQPMIFISCYHHGRACVYDAVNLVHTKLIVNTHARLFLVALSRPRSPALQPREQSTACRVNNIVLRAGKLGGDDEACRTASRGNTDVIVRPTTWPCRNTMMGVRIPVRTRSTATQIDVLAAGGQLIHRASLQ